MLRHNKKQDHGIFTGISEEELKSCTCPISKFLFFFPLKAPECGHVFENAEIRARLSGINKTCPISGCEKVLEIGKLVHDSKLFKEINCLIEKKPRLAAGRYFPIPLFTLIIQKPDISPADNILLCHMIAILEANPDILNKINPETGYSPLFILTNYRERGHSILAENAKLRINITFAGLNSPSGINNNKNLTPLLMLLGLKKKGLSILASDRDLRQKIDPHTLSLAAEAKGTEHDGVFPLLPLVGCPEGRKLLRDCPDLIEKITPEALNTICKRGKFKGVSPLLLLASKPDGLDLLHDHYQLRHKIRASALEAISESKEFCEGVSPLFIFTATQKGRELLLMEEGSLTKVITPAGLNTICRVGSNRGTSPVYFLIAELAGRELLIKFPHLRKMITLDTLCVAHEKRGVGQGVFPLLVLAGINGVSLLRQAPDLREKITADALLQVCQGGIHYGKSPYSLLKEHNTELLIKILKENIFLQSDLGSRISIEDEQFFEGRGIFFPSGRQLGEVKQDSSTSSIIQNLKINPDNEEHLLFWSNQTKTCFHGYGGVEVIHRATGNKYRVPTRIHKMLQIAAAKDEYKTSESFSEAISQAGSQKPSFWNNPFSWMTRAEKTDQLYTQDSKSIANFKV